MIYKIDANATHWINSWASQSQLADLMMVWVSSIGVPILVFAVACQWWARHDRQRTRHVLLAAGFSFLSAKPIRNENPPVMYFWRLGSRS